MSSKTRQSKLNRPQSSSKTSRRAIATEWQKPLTKRTLAQLHGAAPADAWAIWCDHLSHRKKIIPLSKLLPKSKYPLKWSVALSLQRGETLAFIEKLHDHFREKKDIQSTNICCSVNCVLSIRMTY